QRLQDRAALPQRPGTQVHAAGLEDVEHHVVAGLGPRVLGAAAPGDVAALQGAEVEAPVLAPPDDLAVDDRPGLDPLPDRFDDLGERVVEPDAAAGPQVDGALLVHAGHRADPVELRLVQAAARARLRRRDAVDRHGQHRLHRGPDVHRCRPPNSTSLKTAYPAWPALIGTARNVDPRLERPGSAWGTARRPPSASASALLPAAPPSGLEKGRADRDVPVGSSRRFGCGSRARASRTPVGTQGHVAPAVVVELDAERLVQLDPVLVEAEHAAGHVDPPYAGRALADLCDGLVPVLVEVLAPRGQRAG